MAALRRKLLWWGLWSLALVVLLAVWVAVWAPVCRQIGIFGRAHGTEDFWSDVVTYVSLVQMFIVFYVHDCLMERIRKRFDSPNR